MHEDDTLAWLRGQVDDALAEAEAVRAAGPAAFVGAEQSGPVTRGSTCWT